MIADEAKRILYVYRAVNLVDASHKEAFDMAIEALSSSENPKMGRWIYRKEEDSYRCSLCTFPCHKDNLGAIPTKYCAGCGAVMEVDDES